MRRGANLVSVGAHNERLLLDAIRRASDGATRVELTQATGLSPQTVTNICARLLANDLVREVGTRPTVAGKPPVILTLNSEGRYAIGVHIDPAAVTYVILDLNSTVVARRETPTPAASDPDSVLAEISSTIEALILESGTPRSLILGVGIAAPGPIDAELGLVLDPPNLPGWTHVPLRDYLSRSLKLPVLLDKDVIAGAVAEWWMGGDEEFGDLLFVYLGTGVGAGLVLDGSPVRGASSNAGDIGTLPVSIRGQLGILGVATAPAALVRRARALGGLPDEPSLPSEREFAELCAKAAAGDASFTRLLDDAGEAIASAVVSIVNLLDISRVVIGGRTWDWVEPFYLPAVRSQLQHGTVARSLHAPSIGASRIGLDVVAIGAACLILDNELSPRPSALLFD